MATDRKKPGPAPLPPEQRASATLPPVRIRPGEMRALDRLIELDASDDVANGRRPDYTKAGWVVRQIYKAAKERGVAIEDSGPSVSPAASSTPKAKRTTRRGT